MLKRFAVLFWCLVLPMAWAAPVIEYGSTWKYFIGVGEASSPDNTAWRYNNFDDSKWASGPAPIGYASPPTASTPLEFTIATTLPSSSTANYTSVYYRGSFNVLTTSTAGHLTLNVEIDDGYIVWINGTEVARYNVPASAPAYNGTAPNAIEATLISTPLTNDLATLLVPGNNIVAVQVYQAGLTSSDLFFDLNLESDRDDIPPSVADLDPAAGATVSQLTSIEVLFSENVVGVDASDLLINGTAATSVNAANPRDYVFTFPQPPNGPVSVQWAASHGIVDASTNANAFPGGSWSYTLDTNIPPPTVLISEFLADNNKNIKDDDGVHSDWIELYNGSGDVVNLDGWYLTDTTNNLTKWRFPAFNLPANAYLLVWASGLNRTNPAAQLHTNFKLTKDGGFLALVDPRGSIASQFASYPAQRTDISYGRDVLDPINVGFFATPSPGARNSTTGQGFSPEPTFSVAEGVYTNSTLTVAISAPVGEIRYTLDGSTPTTASALYTAPLSITTSRTIKARVFQTGVFPGPIVAKAYLLVDNTIASFQSKLPVIVISTTGQGIVDHPAQGTPRTFASIVGVDTFRGLSSPIGHPDYVGQGGISVRGQTSSGFPKRPYRLELQDDYGNDRNSDWFGFPKGADWILNNPYSDKPFLQNFLAYELFEKMGHYSVRRRFVEVFLNTAASGRMSYGNSYAGIYLLLEKIKVDDNRVPIARLTPYDTTEPNISGGYMFKKDKDTAGDLNFSSSGGSAAGFSGQTLKIHEPHPREITSQQLTWINNYINQFEKALYASNWKTATGTNHYSNYIDINSFVDQHWIVEFAKQIDGYRLSNYMSKDRNGKIQMAPIWDYNLSFGNADYLDGSSASGWYWPQLGENDHIWLRRLMCGTPDSGGTTGDPDFLQRIADRWSELRTNVMNSTNVLARVDEMAALLNEAAARDFAKWPRLGTYVWPNAPYYVTPTNYAGIIAAMKTFIRGRYNWIDTQYLIPPRLSIPEGRVPSGMTVTLSGTSNIYYTTDGSDPRLPGGGLSTKATLYSGPITISNNSRVFARTRSGTRWSGPVAASYIVQPVTLALTEIMYHPADAPSGSIYSSGDFEYLEFKNTGAAAFDLQGFMLTNAVSFTFPSYTLNPGARVLVVRNRAAFESRYGTSFPVIGEYIGQLSNSGDRIVVLGANKEVVLSVKYDTSWQPTTDGPGFSLVLADESVAPDALNLGASWTASAVANGSPGAAESAIGTLPRVVINEARTRPDASAIGVVELQNLSSAPANISGWFITDNFASPKKYRFPTNTIIPAGGFLNVPAPVFLGANSLSPFSLDPLGEEIYLFSGDANTNITSYAHGFKYGVVATNATFGRYVNSVGTELFAPQVSATLGAANSGPSISPIVVSEIMYHPPDVFANGAYWNNTEDEFIEIYNRSGVDLQLFDAAHATNTWKISGDVDFSFPTNTTLDEGAYLLLVNFNPASNAVQLAAFKQKYSVPSGVQIVGPYSGNLNNGGGSVKISYPDAPLSDGTVPFITTETINYGVETPWPSAADAVGFALSRKDANAFGNDPANWAAAAATAGAANSIAGSPTITAQPIGQLALAGQNVTLTVQATGGLKYQWRRNGTNILGATNPTLSLTNIQPSQAGTYSVVVSATAAAITSSPATVFVGRDNDRDGIDDDWELAHGLNPFNAADATLDADSDGLTNLQEYFAGTDPQNAQNSFTLDQISGGNNTVLRFRAAANRTYSVQYSDTMPATSWTKLADVNGGAADVNATVTDTASTPTRYYRLVTPAQ